MRRQREGFLPRVLTPGTLGPTSADIRKARDSFDTFWGMSHPPFGAAFLLVKAGARNKPSPKSMSTLHFQGIRGEQAERLFSVPACVQGAGPVGRAGGGGLLRGQAGSPRAEPVPWDAPAPPGHRVSLGLDDTRHSWLCRSISKDALGRTWRRREGLEDGQCPGTAWGCRQQQKEGLGYSHE